MGAYGYHAVNVDRQSVTNGLALTLILIFGLLLAPLCIGLIILCFLPTAFSTKYVVSYIGQQYMGGYAQSMQPYAGGYPHQPYAGGYPQQPYPGGSPHPHPMPGPNSN